jgi:hypothetical protein
MDESESNQDSDIDIDISVDDEKESESEEEEGQIPRRAYMVTSSDILTDKNYQYHGG